jgi:putative ABC transport system substrate-binding protein
VFDATAPGSRLAEEHARTVATALRLSVVPYHASNQADLEAVLAKLAHARLDGLTVGGPLPALLGYVNRIVDVAAQMRLPFAFPGSSQAEVRAIFWFGASLPQAYRDAAGYVDRILKGAKPADLPIRQPTRFDLVVNQKYAKSLGIAVPRAVLLRADRVIE